MKKSKTILTELKKNSFVLFLIAQNKLLALLLLLLIIIISLTKSPFWLIDIKNMTSLKEKENYLFYINYYKIFDAWLKWITKQHNNNFSHCILPNINIMRYLNSIIGYKIQWIFIMFMVENSQCNILKS